ncbi:TlpA family protein disulfide reductase [Mucilaginibacter sp. NFX135]|uniref:TlpA family protein disulfide reductase n=1 Tax=Mucilaginibacter sp. NFX135 TaxID=3402687 RepID=UPI003AFB6005
MKFIISLCFVLFCHQAFANVRISGELVGFGSAKGIVVYLPVGGYANGWHRTIYPVIDNKIDIDFNIPSPVFIKINVGGIRNIFVLARPGDDIKFKLLDTNDKYNSLKFEGSNAAGQYWYNLYNIHPLDNRIRHGELMTAILDKNKDITLKKLGGFINSQTLPLDSLYKEKKIDAEFYKLAKTDIRSMHVYNMVQEISMLQDKIDDRERIIRNQIIINALNAFAGPENMANTKAYFGKQFLGSYYTPELAANKKASKSNTYELGPYNGLLLAPDSMKSTLLGDILLFQQTDGSSEFEFDKAYAQFKIDFPKSPYIPLINSLRAGGATLSITNNIDFIVDTASNFSSVEDLKKHFKGKNVYIDLWATWCVPCRMEFPAYDLIKTDLKKNNINCVYISIDKLQAKPSWKDMVVKSHLEGYHILANDKLKADIKKLVYKNGQVSIPRYILLNKTGRIISLDAPRPSSLKLVKMLNEL